MNPLKIGVVGLGRIGQVHIENLVYRIPAAKVIAASTPSQTGYEFTKNLGVTEIYQDSLKVINHKNIDAVIGTQDAGIAGCAGHGQRQAGRCAGC